MMVRRLGQLASFVIVLILAATAVLMTLAHIADDGDAIGSPFASIVEFAAMASFGAVAVVLMVRRPENPIGWLLMLPAVGSFLNVYATYALIAAPESGLPGATAAAAMDFATWSPFVCAMALVLLMFPSGRITSRRLRVTARIAVAAAVISFLDTLVTLREFDPPFDAHENPLVVGALEPYAGFGFIPVMFLMLLVPVAAFDLFRRFRRSKGEERQQFRWLAYSGGLVVGFFPLYIAVGSTSDELAYTLFTVALMTLPVSIGIAVLKYRLYEIDRLVNRTLTYGLVTVGLGAVYVALVAAFQVLLQPVSGGSDVALVATTLVVAALFLPARKWTQGLVNRRFNRRAYDAARVVETFGLRLREEIDLDTLRYELLGVLGETIQPSHANVWLRPGEGRL